MGKLVLIGLMITMALLLASVVFIIQL